MHDVIARRIIDLDHVADEARVTLDSGETRFLRECCLLRRVVAVTLRKAAP
jgi:hypothetical protein